ncbi:MAG: serine hydrolase [Phenylobacterium sp.]
MRANVLATGALLIAVALVGGGWIGASHLSRAADARLTAAHPKTLPVVAPPAAPPVLQNRLEALALVYGEPVGIAVTDVTEGWTALVDGDTPYPQQSVSKLWVAVSALDAVDRGALRLDQLTVMTPDDRSVFFQPLAEMITTTRHPTLTVADLLSRAITESDNSANDKLMRELGGAEAVTGILARKGLEELKVGAYERDLQARIAGLEWQPEYGLGWTFKAARAKLPDAIRENAEAAYLADPMDGAAPAAITAALAALKRGELLSPASTTVLLDLLSETRTGPRRLKGGLPAGWTIGHKTGTGPDWRHGSVGINDVGLITAPDGRTYAVAVMMRRTRAPVPQRLAFMQAVTRAVVAHWTSLPAEGRQLAATGAGPAAGL